MDRSEKLKALLQEYHSSHSGLPDLKTDTSWIDQLKQRISELWRQFKDLFRSDESSQDGLGDFLEGVFQFLFQYRVELIISALLLYLSILFFVYLRNNRKFKDRLHNKSLNQSLQQSLVTELSEATKEQNWKRALRTRWKLYLAARGWVPSFTLSESIYVDARLIACQGYYIDMFDCSEVTERVYQEFNQVLDQLK